jgi:hypothetical protein
VIIAGILAAEIAFWVVLGIALVCRYALQWRRVSTGMLLVLPVIDLALLAFVSVDLASGARPQDTHALAAVYLGVTVAFGGSIVRWADGKLARRTGRPVPPRPEKGSGAWVRGLWAEWFRVLLAAVVATAVLAFLALVVRGEPVPVSLEAAAGNPLLARVGTLGIVVVIWFLAGPAFARRTRP